MAYNIDFVKTNLPEALEIVTDAVINPKFNPWEVDDQIKKLQADIKVIKDNPQTTLLEVSHVWGGSRVSMGQGHKDNSNQS
jgi:mitochondrial-processing peptidase subunit alpha